MALYRMRPAVARGANTPGRDRRRASTADDNAMPRLRRARGRLVSLAVLVGAFSATCQAQTSASGTMIIAPSAGGIAVNAGNIANSANVALPISTSVTPAAPHALDVHPVSVAADTTAPRPLIVPSGSSLSSAPGAPHALQPAPLRRIILTQRTPMPIIPAYAAQHPYVMPKMVSHDQPVVVTASTGSAPTASSPVAAAPVATGRPLAGHLPEPVIDPSIGAGNASAAVNDTRIVIEPGAPAAPAPATLRAADGGVARQLDTAVQPQPVPPQFVAANTFPAPAMPPPALIPNLDQPGKQNNEAIRVAAEQFLRQQAAGLPGQVVITVKPAAPSGLAQCASLEPFLPPGARVWGRTTVGMRCVGDHPWTLYLQARVAVNGSYYVASRDIAPGQSISQADIEARQTDLTNMPRSLVTDLSQVVGTAAQSRITAGMPLRTDLLRTVNAVKFDQPVKLVAQGAGFSISSEGRALGNAAPGESVQVRTGSGQIVSGVVRDGGTVEVPM
ncbi:flagellar basal body P-ring formation chaperone FlgA [Burkholderia sp. L27(2015)]|uniref:flagellar basal body P-ring formation chaperone FlgA n=1 Tax=Burkholderia sp. L27(2015) TaxID=1641858 RepID=UPI00131E9F2F|nr:flagellar basal body P-ring formation chaperone FlgA [Burkholderia sp. L27(2015)]